MANKNLIRGEIIKHGYNLDTFASKIGMSRYSLYKKMTGKTEFRASEIEKACLALDIPKKDVGKYFFCN